MSRSTSISGPVLALAGADGRRRTRYRMFKGGKFEGPKMRGTLVPGGGDWEIVEPDGTAHLDVSFLSPSPS